MTENNLGHARQLLRIHVPQPGQEDLRGFEWRYFWKEAMGVRPRGCVEMGIVVSIERPAGRFC